MFYIRKIEEESPLRSATGSSGAGVEAALQLRITHAVVTGNASSSLGIDLVSGIFPTALKFMRWLPIAPSRSCWSR